MNCNVCPHMMAIVRALEPCQNCSVGLPHNRVSITPETTDWAMARRVPDFHVQADGVTSLSPEAEDATRKLLATMAELEPIELLLLQNVLKRKSYADFRFTLAALNRNLRQKERELNSKDSQGFRQLAHLWARKIEAKLPRLRDLFKARIEEA